MLKVCIGFHRVEWLPSPKFHSYQRGWLEVSVQRTIGGCDRIGDERYDWAHETTVFEDVRVKSSCVAVARGSLSTYRTGLFSLSRAEMLENRCRVTGTWV